MPATRGRPSPNRASGGASATAIAAGTATCRVRLGGTRPPATPANAATNPAGSATSSSPTAVATSAATIRPTRASVAVIHTIGAFTSLTSAWRSLSAKLLITYSGRFATLKGSLDPIQPGVDLRELCGQLLDSGRFRGIGSSGTFLARPLDEARGDHRGHDRDEGDRLQHEQCTDHLTRRGRRGHIAVADRGHRLQSPPQSGAEVGELMRIENRDQGAAEDHTQKRGGDDHAHRLADRQWGAHEPFEPALHHLHESHDASCNAVRRWSHR